MLAGPAVRNDCWLLRLRVMTEGCVVVGHMGQFNAGTLCLCAPRPQNMGPWCGAVCYLEVLKSLLQVGLRSQQPATSNVQLGLHSP